MTMLIFVLGGLGLIGFLNELHVRNLELIALGWLIVWTFLLFQVKCPNCQKSVAYQGTVGRVSVFAGFTNASCKNCGYDLTKAYRK